MRVESVIHFDTRWFGDHGIGRFARELFYRLPGTRPLAIAGSKLTLLDPLACTLAASRLQAGCYFSPGFNPPLYSPVPLIFTIHDLIHLKIPGESTPLRRAYYEWVVRPAARRAARILTVSEHSKRDILAWTDVPAERVHVVGNGVSEAFTPTGPAHREDRPYLLHVGRRASHKNIGRLLAAFARSRARSAARLMFTGEPDPATQHAAAAAGIADRIAFAGTADDKRLAALYRGAMALVFPSLYEGFGLPVVEAMACGTPVITADATSTAEIAASGCALLIDPLDEVALAQAIDLVAGDGALRASLSAGGIARSADFRWSLVVERTQAAIAAVS